MIAIVQEAIRAGALGFSTSRSPDHLTPDDRPVASRAAPFSEVRAIVHAMGKLGAGIFQLAMERGNTEKSKRIFTELADLSIETGRPITFGSLSRRDLPGQWRILYDIITESNRMGARIFAQVHSRELSSILSFETTMPFDTWDVWRDMRALPLDAQNAALRDPDTRGKLIESANRPLSARRARPNPRR